MKKLLTIGLVLFGTVLLRGGSAFGATIEVSTASALSTALENANDDDEIVLATGSYTLTGEFTLANAVTLRSASGKAEDVILTANDGKRLFVLDNASAKLLNLTLQGGKVTSVNNNHGGNVRIDANGGTVEGCVIRNGYFSIYCGRNSSAGGGGAGISCISESGLIKDCVITNNLVYNTQGYVTGGGVYMKAGLAKGCFIGYNKAVFVAGRDSYGGGVELAGTAKLENCTIVGNKATHGGGIDVYHPSDAKVASSVAVNNCLIWDNASDGTEDICAGPTTVYTNCVARLVLNENSTAVESPAVQGVLYEATCATPSGIGARLYDGTSPSAAFTISKAEGAAPLSVTFTADAKNISGIVNYQWDFDGDGTIDETTTDETVTHVYATALYAAPRLTVYSNDGFLTYVSEPNTIRATSTTHYVNAKSTNPVTPYATEATAARTIGDALVVAQEGDEVVVLPCAYTFGETLDILKDITVRSSTGRAEDVILTAPSSKRLFVLDNASAKLLNLTLQNGTAEGGSYTHGGNVRINANGGIVEGCVIRGGTFGFYGERSNGGGGAGISCVGANGLIQNCIITNNAVKGSSGIHQGGGLYMTAGTAVGCYIAKNKAPQNGARGVYGGGVSLRGTAKLVNCTVVENECPIGAGIDVYRTDNEAASSVKVVNCFIWNNVGDGTGDVYCGASEAFNNCLARYAINEDCLSAAAPATSGAFYVPTPAFAGLDKSIVVEGVTLPEKDVLGETRVNGAAADLGASEYATTGPDVALTVSASSGFTPFETTLTAVTSGMDGITTYRWDFDGDGTIDETTTESSVTHVYATAGALAPRVTVDYAGGSLTYAAPAETIKALPKTMYVNTKSTNPVSPYMTPETAAKTIADALSAASDGQTIILLAAGSPYVVSAAVDVNKAVTVCGETGNPEEVVVKTSKNGLRTFRLANEDAFLHSLAIEAQYFVGYGAGLIIESAGGTASNCVFRNCHVAQYWSSAAVNLIGPKALLTHCVITNCTTLTGSAGDKKTAGLHLQEGAVAKNCLIANNREECVSGDCCTGGVYAPNGYLYNCTIVDNTARRCGGIRINAGGVYNCVFAGNKGTYYTDRNNLDTESVKVASLFHNCASDDDAAINDTCVIGTPASFFESYTVQNYTVSAGSPLKNAGVSDGLDLEGTDLVGFKRISGGKVDIGCYEFDSDKMAGSLSANITQGIVPQTVTFTAGVTGASEGNVFSYSWDFDADGTVDEMTAVPTVQHTYAKGGQYSVAVEIKDTTAGTSLSVTQPNLLYFCAPTMYVVTNKNENAAFPYDSWETASDSLMAAVDATIDGVEVVVSNGTHAVAGQLNITHAINLHSLTANPEDTVVMQTGAQDTEPGFKMSNVDAFVHDIAWDGGAARRSGWRIEVGGTISNCVMRNFKNWTHWASCGAVYADAGGVVSHCVMTNNTQEYWGDESKGLVRIYGRMDNCLIANNSVTTGPFVWLAGECVNNTIVENTLATDTTQFHLTGALTNNLFLANGTSVKLYATTGACAANNLCDIALDGWYCAAAESILDSAAPTPWTLTSAANNRYRGAKGVVVSAFDLAGQPRKVGARCDLGCYENQKTIGLTILVR